MHHSENNNSTLNSKDFVKLAVGVCLQYDTVEWARSILDNLVLEDVNDTAFYEYNDVAVSLAEDELTWFGMDSIQKAKVAELSLTDYEVAVNAQAVLTLVDDSAYFRVPEMAIDSSGKWDENEPSANQQSLTEAENIRNISLYPNPFANSFNISYAMEKEKAEFKIEVYDLVGRIVKTQILRNVQNGNITIDLGQCLGVYIVRISSDGETVFKSKAICLNH